MKEGETPTTPTDALSGLMDTFSKNKGVWMGQAAMIFLQFNAMTKQVSDLSAAVARLEKTNNLILHRLKKK